MENYNEKQKAELEALSKVPGEEIDFSDIPETLDWSKGIRGAFHQLAAMRTTPYLDDVKAYGSCRCGPCQCEKLKHPTLKPTAAEAWLTQGPRDPGHSDLQLRTAFIDRSGFAVLNRRAVEFIRPYGPLLEAGAGAGAGAGTGYWASELRQAGIDIIATDPSPESRWPGPGLRAPVERLSGLEAINRYPERNLLLCWPDVARWPAEVIARFRDEYLLYVGEDENGCTGGPEMFEVLKQRYELAEFHEIPRFRGMNDRLRVYRRTGE